MLGIVGAALLSIGNGGNDIANSMGVLTGANALSVRQALVLGGIFEFLGAITMGQTVAKTISKGVIDPTHYRADGCRGTLEYSLGMFCVLVGAGNTFSS
jgi:phosphate/sulfate permease